MTSPASGPWITDDMACLSEDPELFFAGDRESKAKAKEICARCPRIDMCRERALAIGEADGVFGGMDTQERRDELARRSKQPSPRRDRPGRGSRAGKAA